MATGDIPDTPHARLEWARQRAGYDDKAEFARVANVNPTTYRAYENGQNGFSKHAARFGNLLGTTAEWLLEGTGDPGRPPAKPVQRVDRIDRAPDVPATRNASAGETAPILRLDLSLAMGPGTDIDNYIEVETVEFDLGFLRAMTPSSPGMLRLVSGSGDSMFPTLIDSDMLFIDTTQRILNMQDRIWAISLFGAGALKRLRAVGKGRVLVISDNPDVPDQEVDSEDISIVGRLVGFFRRN